MSASYAGLVRQPRARRLIYALTTAGISFGMVSLTVLLTVHHASGSYSAAGFAVGALALTAGVSGPFRGRLVDRLGPRTWVPGFGIAFATALVVFDLVAASGGATWLLVALGALIGCTFPPIFSTVRAMWAAAVGPELVRRGYAVTSLISDVGQVVGPVLASTLFLVSSRLGPLVCAGTCLAATLLARSAHPAGASAERPSRMPRLRASGRFMPVLAASIGLGGGLGVIQVAVPTVAAKWHHTGLGGPLLAAFGLGSVLGAIWYGSRSWRRSASDRYLWSVVAVGILISPAALAADPALLGPALLIAGLAFGPATVSMFEALDVLAPGSGAEALSWVTTTEASGAAIGSALAAPLVARASSAVVFLVAALLFCLPAATGLVLGRRFSR